MLDDFLKDMGWDGLQEDILISLGNLIVRVNVTQEVQKNTRVARGATGDGGEKKSPVGSFLLAKEELTGNLSALVIEEEMLP
jgi:hypothetical protein